METASPTVHATALVIGRHGVLLRGPSGSGKSALALHLFEEAQRDGLFSTLVADDRVHLTAGHGRLIATAPPSLAGRIEVRGYGIIPVSGIRSTCIDLIADLEPAEAVERFPFDDKTEVDGVTVRRIMVPQKAVDQASTIIRSGLLHSPVS